MYSWALQHTRSFRWITGITAVLSIMLAMWSLAYTSDGEPIRNVINATLTPYDGCMCQDCVVRYLAIPPPRRPKHDNVPFFVAMVLGASSIVSAWMCVAMPFLARRAVERENAAKNACPSCGYNIRGLPAPLCPECGESLQTSPR
jgi:predicted RNA-binding Zn-ribbon protein involved in translation (DUF1610 family)